MKNSLMSVSDKVMLWKWTIIESVNDKQKNMAQIEHSRRRASRNFINNILSESQYTDFSRRNQCCS